MAESETESSVYFAISNIPVNFHAADLRNYFSQFVESRGFRCFHYRHRPEVLRDAEGPEDAASGRTGEAAAGRRPTQGSGQKQPAKSCCCVVSVRDEHADRFVRMYARNHWIDAKGSWLSRRCVIKRIKVALDGGEHDSTV